jgi:hypothetical protein
LIRTAVIAAVCAAMAAGTAHATPLSLYNGVGGGENGSSNTGYIGTWFQVTTVPILLQQLGVWDSGPDGTVYGHQVTLWENAGGNTWNQVATDFIGAGTVGGADGFAYGPTTFNLVLDPGLYALGATHFGGDYQDNFPDSQIGGHYSSTGSGTAFANGWAEVGSYGGPADLSRFTSGGVFYGTSNMTYTPAPEPATVTLVITGIAGAWGARRRRARRSRA